MAALSTKGTTKERVLRKDEISGGIDRHAMLSDVFHRMDEDNSGTVDLAEFMAIFSAAGEKNALQQMQLMDQKEQGVDYQSTGDATTSFHRDATKAKRSDLKLQADEFVSHMLEMTSADTDLQFHAKVDTWLNRLDEGHRALNIRRVFAQMDVDNSGYVDINEFSGLLASASQSASGDEAAAVNPRCLEWVSTERLENLDTNDDGQLGIDEWVAHVIALEEGTDDDEFDSAVRFWMVAVSDGRRATWLRAVFGRMDKDMSGYVDVRELKHVATDAQQEVVPDLFDRLDNDRDGRITVDEWTSKMLEWHADSTDEQMEAECHVLLALLTTNQRVEMRSRFAMASAASLVMAARAAGVTHVIFCRHGNTPPTPPTAPSRKDRPHEWKLADQAKPLTDRGQAQCVAAKSAWFGRLPVRHVLVSSPALRCGETAAFMGGRVQASSELADAPPVLMIESLYPAGQEEVCEALHAQRGDAPLRGFLEVDGGVHAFGVYAERVCAELATKFRLHAAAREPGTYLALFGHAVFLNSVAYALAAAAGVAECELDALLGIDLGESEGILVPLFGGPVQHMYVPC